MINLIFKFKYIQLTEDGSLNTTFITDYAMKNIFKDQWQKELGQKSLNKCFEESYSE